MRTNDAEFLKQFPDYETLFPFVLKRVYNADPDVLPNVDAQGYILYDGTGRQITSVLPYWIGDFIHHAVEEYRAQSRPVVGHAGKIICRIVIPINPITKKNAMQITRFRNGRVGLQQSARYKKYAQDVKRLGKTIYRLPYHGQLPIDRPIAIESHFYRATRHRVDVSNLESAIMDVLVAIGCIADDDWTHVISTDGTRAYYDKENPRTEVIIRTWISDDG